MVYRESSKNNRHNKERNMQINNLSSNEAVLKELGSRIKDVRISAGMKQKDLAARAGVSLRTISNLETGSDVRLSVLLNVMRALGELDNFEMLIPEQEIRPSDYVKYGRKSMRVRSASIVREDTGWKWGEDK
jgi:transcriptional regulator with XRE-family HTH domain